MDKRKSLYNNFHKYSKNQIKLISKEDFTYHNILKFTDLYIKKPSRVLDIGCGVGSVDLYLVSLGNQVTGIDISKKAIDMAKKSSKILKLDEHVIFNVIDFPKNIPKGVFDVVICSEILEHLIDDNGAILAIKKLLKPKGILIASSPSFNAPLYKLGLLDNFDKSVGHIRRYTASSFRKLFSNPDFKILDIQKTEGILRNFLYTNKTGGFLLKIFKRDPFSKVVTCIDNIMVNLFGESDIVIVVQKK